MKRRRLPWALWLVALMLLALTIGFEADRPGPLEDPLFLLTAILMTVGYSTVGALVASRHPRNPIGWLFLAVGLGTVLSGLLDNYAARGLASPGSLPGAAMAAGLNQLTFILAVPPIPLVLLLFPNGRVPSPRWRPVAWAMVGGPLLAVLGFLVKPGPVGGDEYQVANPIGVDSLEAVAGAVIAVGGVVSIPAALACVLGLVMRFRRARGEERQQLRWLAYAAGTAAFLLVTMFLPGGDEGPVGDAQFIAFFVSLGVGIPAASAIAILKYRLYDLDIVIKKTVVFALVGALITGAYLLVVLAIPTLVVGVGTDTEAGFNLIQFAAVALIALVINPVRNRARRLADRLVYGKRASPYEVLSEFSERMGGTYSTEDVLPRMVQLISAGTGARRAEVWLRVGDEMRLEAGWPNQPDGHPEPRPLVDGGLPPFDSADAFPVTHQGELLGALAVSMPPSDPLTPAQRKLLQDLAAQAGLVLRNVALTADLRARLEELRASRQRLVAAQDEERRRLERNIHDGAQQQLVALGVKLGLARRLSSDPGKLDPILTQLQEETNQALQDLRDLARGIYPPLLQDRGLSVALEAQARKSPVPTTVEADSVGRYPQEAEAAVYFCVLEALQNVAKYAGASAATVTLSAVDGVLSFTVTDDGSGFDPDTTPPGSGLTNMSDRMAALGGEIEIRSQPGRGTTVIGRLPVRSLTATE
jgi:signal transduction histidine kinase